MIQGDSFSDAELSMSSSRENKNFKKYCKTGMFYEGKFKNDRPNGVNVKYWYKCGNLMFEGEL